MIESVRNRHEMKVEEVAERLRGEGYDVRRGKNAAEKKFDLIAERGNERVAIEVKDATELKAAAREIMELRDFAVSNGFTDFRVMVAHPPRTKSIAVPGLNKILLDIAVSEPLKVLPALSDDAVVTDVHSVDVQSIVMDGGAVHVLGSAVAVVEIGYKKLEGNGDGVIAEFPLSFDVILNPDLTLRECLQLSAETSSFVAS